MSVYVTAATTRIMYSNKLIIPSGTTWNAGTWTWNLNVRQLDTGLKLVGVDICRVNSSGVSQSTIGTDSYNIIIGNSYTVFSGTISGSSQTPSAGDFVVINFVFQNTTGGNKGGEIRNNQIINSPFT
jgi:hypothetical protein